MGKREQKKERMDFNELKWCLIYKKIEYLMYFWRK